MLIRRERHSLDDWPPDVGVFVRTERHELPILDAPRLAAPGLTVLAISHRGEFLQLLKQTQIVDFANPLGSGLDGSGIWYQVRLPDGREGWLLARSSASGAAPFAVFVRRKVPRDTLPETLGVIIGILFWPVVLTIWFLRSRRKKAAEPSASVGDRGSGGWTSAAEDGDGEGSVEAESTIKDSGRESEAGTRKCPDCYGPAIDPFDERGDGLCSVCYGRGGGGFLDEIAYHGSKLIPFGEDERPRCSNCDGSGECPTCDGTGKI